MAVVKADGYGHDAKVVSDYAIKGGASQLGVATLNEGIKLRSFGVKKPILILGNLYTKKINNIWGKSMAWGRRIAQVFYRFPRTGYQLGVKRKTAPKRIAQILSGEMSYEDIAKRVIRRLLTKSGS